MCPAGDQLRRLSEFKLHLKTGPAIYGSTGDHHEIERYWANNKSLAKGCAPLRTDLDKRSASLRFSASQPLV